jgi:tRNA pseudouridine synthase 10
MSFLEDVRAVLATGPVCDACLGRPFADRSFGLTNAERGRALRTTVALADDEPYEPSADCWVCEGQCWRHDEWAERAADALSGVSFETYQVGTRVPPLIEENDALLQAEAGRPEDAGESFKSAFNREVGKRLGAGADTEVDFDRPDVVVLLNLERGDVDAQLNPAFVYGRYRKLQRDVPQTEWPCRECGGGGKQFDPDEGEVGCDHCGGTGYLYPTSVEQEVAPHVRAAMDGEDAVFHGAGREDVDARMLGTGRPFVVEVKRPHARRPDLDAVRAEIEEASGVVEVEDLAHATHEMVERVKELDASKRYRAGVTFDEPVAADALATALADLDGATIEQYTPGRVDHRRAGKTRVREVYAAHGSLVPADADRDPGDPVDEPAKGTRAELTFHTEGGTYVKELVSGDEGRTEPSLAGLLVVGAEVAALDVLAVEGEDEPFDDEAFLRR